MSLQPHQSRELRDRALDLKLLGIEIDTLARDNTRPARDGSWPSKMNLVARLVDITRVAAAMESLLRPKYPVRDASDWDED
jgi:hypothetical protein